MTLLEKFQAVDLNGRAILTWEHGEFIVAREYYGKKVSLYSLIERVELITEINKILPFKE